MDLALAGHPHEVGSVTGQEDSLDVSLHDGELAEEVELTVRLIVAANESDRPLSEQEVDDLLEVRRPARVGIPRQGSAVH